MHRDQPPMNRLDQNEAFAVLSKLLGGEGGSEWVAASPAIERLRYALSETPQRASELDLAVLLRQALCFEHARRDFVVAPTICVSHTRLANFAGWQKVSLDARATDNGLIVSALPWTPNWLDASDPKGADAYAASEAPCRFLDGQDVAGDPFLSSVGRPSYRSASQRAAVRAALSTPPSGTLVVALATGEG